MWWIEAAGSWACIWGLDGHSPFSVDLKKSYRPTDCKPGNLMDSEHILSLTTDYALGLLSAEERRRVERHAGQCPACRAALQNERGLEALVRGTVRQAARPAPGRLAALRPSPVAPPAVVPLYRRLAPVTMITVLLALGLLFGRGLSFTPAVYADGTPTLSAASNHIPTATIAAAIAPVTAEAELQRVNSGPTAAPDPQASAPATAPLYAPTPAPPAGTAAGD
jgi:anti-sigma factor RsiW